MSLASTHSAAIKRESSASAAIERESLALATPYAAPDGGLEALVADLFAEVFEIDRIGANDDFFDLGGDSLQAEALSLRISERTGREFQMSALVDHASPRKIVALLQGNSPAAPTPAAGLRVRPPIFIVHGRDGLTFPKPDFRRALAEDQRLYMFELPGIRGGPSYDRIEDIAAFYVGKLQETYPEGPVLLASFCMGALIALEMAAQLAAKGRPVHQLVLFDPSVPKPRRGKHGIGGEWPPRKARQEGLKGRLRRALRLPALRADRELPAFTRDVEDYRRRFQRKDAEGRQKYPDLKLSIEAQARLLAAYRQHHPPPFHGPVAILSSVARDPTYRDPSTIWSEFVPRREIHSVVEVHHEIGGAATARLLQSVVDAAVAQG